MMDSREVLPLPLGPISASTSPGLQQPLTSHSTCMQHSLVSGATIGIIHGQLWRRPDLESFLIWCVASIVVPPERRALISSLKQTLSTR